MNKSIILLLLALLGSGCSDRRHACRLIKTPIEQDVTMLAYTNSHGGFHGDGEAWCVFTFSEKQLEAFLKVVRDRKGWHRLPATGDALTVMQQMRPEAVTDLQDGYYFFRDLQQEWDFQPTNETKNPIDKRHSRNYVIAVLNKVTRHLYIYNLDT